ncbi:MAG: hypothetical protein K8T91_20155 [Planctomycetes bacterium]|nr:hypothetical protein [Planctomycetota bacterium]
MVRVTIDTATMSKLHNLSSFMELCDETGRVMGRFIPTPDIARYERLSPPASDEELDRRMREGSERSLDDILRDLEARS